MQDLVALIAMTESFDHDPIVHEVVLVQASEADWRLWQLRAKYLKIDAKKLRAMRKEYYEDSDGEEITDEVLVNSAYGAQFADHGMLRVEQSKSLVAEVSPTLDDEIILAITKVITIYHSRQQNTLGYATKDMAEGVTFKLAYWLALQDALDVLALRIESKITNTSLTGL